jgi:hypothetical protein
MDTPQATQRVDIDEAAMLQNLNKNPHHKLEIIDLTQSKGIVLVGDNGLRRLELFSNESFFLLGRFAEETMDSRHIDLSPFGAKSSSVSRIHARIHMEGNDIYITDLSSRNGTFVNGRSITPHRPKLLDQDTDITLGKLHLKIRFQVQDWGRTS